MNRSTVSRNGRMCRLSLYAGAFFCAATQSWGTTIWEFSDRADSRALQAADRMSAYTASVTAQATAATPLISNSAAVSAVQLTSITPSLLGGANRNGRAYRFAATDSSRVDMSLTSSAVTNRRHRRHPIVTTAAPTLAVATGVPDSGRTILMLGAALAGLVSVRAFRARKSIG